MNESKRTLFQLSGFFCTAVAESARDNVAQRCLISGFHHTHHLSCQRWGKLAVHGIRQGRLCSRPVRCLEAPFDFTEETECTGSFKLLKCVFRKHNIWNRKVQKHKFNIVYTEALPNNFIVNKLQQFNKSLVYVDVCSLWYSDTAIIHF